MANTYSQVYLQFVFVVKGRSNLIHPMHNEELQKYITGIVQNHNQKLICINNVPNHVHMLVGFGTTITMADIMESVKSVSSKFINEKKWVYRKFEWQRGFGVSSYPRKEIDNVIRYICNQQEHHKKISLNEEYLKYLKEYEVDFNEKYLFDWVEDE